MILLALSFNIPGTHKLLFHSQAHGKGILSQKQSQYISSLYKQKQAETTNQQREKRQKKETKIK